MKTPIISETPTKPVPQGQVQMVDLASIIIDPILIRPKNEKHVEELRVDIRLNGLLCPLIVDRNRKILAGGHRLDALLQEQQHYPASFKQHFPDGTVPVMVVDLDVAADYVAALGIHVAENAIRRNPTKEDVVGLYNALVERGIQATAGKPKRGEQTANNIIAHIFNRSPAWARWIRKAAKSASDSHITDPKNQKRNNATEGSSAVHGDAGGDGKTDAALNPEGESISLDATQNSPSSDGSCADIGIVNVDQGRLEAAKLAVKRLTMEEHLVFEAWYTGLKRPE